MPTYNSNILPATTGLTLGNSMFQWTAYLSNVFTGSIQSLSLNSALSGFLRLASTDAITWRNAANNLDLSLSKTSAAITTTPADTLVFSGSGIEGPFISHNPNPALQGELRLASTDAISFRNTVANADVAGLMHNSDDTVTAGGAAGIKQSAILSAIPNPASAGIVRLANGDSVNWRNTANSADEGISNASTGGLLVSGANPNVSLGGVTSSFPMIKRNGNAIDFRLADNSALTAINTNNLASLITSYNGYALSGNGLVASIAVVDLTAQTAAIGSTNLLTGSGSGPAAGQYRVSWNAKVTTPATTGAATSTLGPLTLTYIDPDGVSQAITAGAMIAAGSIVTTSTGNVTTTVLIGIPMLVNIKALQTVSYTFGYASNTAAQMAYNLHIVVERL